MLETSLEYSVLRVACRIALFVLLAIAGIVVALSLVLVVLSLLVHAIVLCLLVHVAVGGITFFLVVHNNLAFQNMIS